MPLRFTVQVAHSRDANVAWRPRSSGLFGRDQALAVEVTRPVKQGEALQMDFGLGKLDNEVLLDYGVLDAANAKVHSRTHGARN